jgi:hypothetical protein
MWKMECMIVLVITEATGMVTKGLKNNLEATPEKRLVYSL